VRSRSSAAPRTRRWPPRSARTGASGARQARPAAPLPGRAARSRRRTARTSTMSPQMNSAMAAKTWKTSRQPGVDMDTRAYLISAPARFAGSGGERVFLIGDGEAGRVSINPATGRKTAVPQLSDTPASQHLSGTRHQQPSDRFRAARSVHAPYVVGPAGEPLRVGDPACGVGVPPSRKVVCAAYPIGKRYPPDCVVAWLLTVPCTWARDKAGRSRRRRAGRATARRADWQPRMP
jgi:hypothetical protein